MHSDLKAQIIGVTQEMTTSKLFFDSNIGHTLFQHNDNLSNTLQAEKISACEGKRNTLLVLSVVQSMRNKDLFNDFYDVLVENTKMHNSIKDPVI